jgi:hypothetical protein
MMIVVWIVCDLLEKVQVDAVVVKALVRMRAVMLSL